MTPAERAQARASLALAEAMRDQAKALAYQAEAQVAALSALLGAEPPTVEAQMVRDQIYSTGQEESAGSRHYGSAARRAREAAEAPAGIESES